jgi:CubicO group peptidase (beta-lactamase class C family)
MKLIHLVILMTVNVFSVFAQNASGLSGAEKADRAVQTFMNKWEITQGAVAVTRNGKLIYNRGFGVPENTMFRIASISKPITATAIMKLIGENELSLDEKVFGKNALIQHPYYLNEIKDKRIFDITVRQLLEHTAGWDRNVGVDGFNHNDPPFFPLHVAEVLGEPLPLADSSFIRFLLRKGLDFTPGKHFAYSNVGYLILGKIIESVSGTSYSSYVEKNIFNPLSITDILPGKTLAGNKYLREADYESPYEGPSCFGDGKILPDQYGGYNIETMGAHGGWIATASDLSKFLLGTDGAASYPDVLPRQLIDTMSEKSSVCDWYGKGWCVNSSGNRWHTGSLEGTASFACITPDGFTFTFLFNSRGDNGKEFWEALDHLPWVCLENLRQLPDMELFAQSKTESVVVENR